MEKRSTFWSAWCLEVAAVTVGPALSDPESSAFSDPGLLLSEGEGDPGQEGKRTVRARRRRRSGPSGSEDRRRAEAPRRDVPTGPPPRPPGGTGGVRPPPQQPSPRPLSTGSGTAPSLPVGQMLGGGRRPPLLIIGLAIVLFVCVAIAMLVFGGPRDSSEVAYVPPTSTPRPAQALSPTATVAQDAPAATLVPFRPPPASSAGQTWLVMLYQDADDKILEQDIYVDLNEAERVGSSDRVHIVAQVDRYRAGYQGDGDWSTTKRFYVIQDQDLNRVASQQIADLGEVNMADGATLVDFVTWAMETFPADKHVLIMSDHGMGWPGGWSDSDPKGRGDPGIPLAAALGDELYMMELDEALGEIRSRTGLTAFELIGMDACLMGHLEVFSALAPHARYAVASQETEPALGWAYTSFLGALRSNPDMDGAAVGRAIVDSYIDTDQRIVDDQARAELLQRGAPVGGLLGMGRVTAAQLVEQMARDSTLTAIDLAAMPELMDSVNELSFVLQGESQPIVARARTYAQSFTSIFGNKVPPSYIDLGNFVQLLKRDSANSRVAQAADRVLASLDRAVIAEKHGPNKPGASGVSLYFPNSQLYQSPVTGAQSYTAVARRFAETSLWDDFLGFHYTGRAFEAETKALVVPDPATAIRGPGAGPIEVSPIMFSSNVAAPGRPVLLSVDIDGPGVGYVYLFVGIFDPGSNSILVADTDYLESDQTREIGGVYYPDWGEGEFTMEFEWEPVVFAVSDGANSALALFTPERYGASYEDAVYTVEGVYTYADGGETRYARLHFRDGVLRQVFGYANPDGTGAPREILPQAGDQFTVLERWLALDDRGNVTETVAEQGGTLAFGDQAFTWEELDAPVGTYVVGFVVEDMDGNTRQAYGQVTVE